MEANPDSQGGGDSSSYQDQTYYEGLDSPLHESDIDYSGMDGEQRSPLREQDRFLPIANVAKIMKRGVPVNGKIAKEAKECVQECVSEFISFITSEAAERCQSEKRKTINGEDILCAMNALGFDNYVEPLKSFLVKFREMSKLECTLMDSSTSQLTPSTSSAPVPNTVQSTVLITPTILASNASGNLTAISNNSLLAGGRQFAILNGAGDVSAGEHQILESGTSLSDVKIPASIAGLGTPIATSLGTTIILPMSTQFTIVNGAGTTVTPADPQSSTGT